MLLKFIKYCFNGWDNFVDWLFFTETKRGKRITNWNTPGLKQMPFELAKNCLGCNANRYIDSFQGTIICTYCAREVEMQQSIADQMRLLALAGSATIGEIRTALKIKNH